MKNFSRHIGRIGARYLPDRCMGEEEEEEGVYSYSSDTVEGPRAPAVTLTTRHSSLTRVVMTNGGGIGYTPPTAMTSGGG